MTVDMCIVELISTHTHTHIYSGNEIAVVSNERLIGSTQGGHLTVSDGIKSAGVHGRDQTCLSMLQQLLLSIISAPTMKRFILCFSLFDQSVLSVISSVFTVITMELFNL